MKANKLFYFFLFVLFLVLIFGCAGKRGLFGNKPDLSKDLVTMNYERFFGHKPETRLYLATGNLPTIVQQDSLTAKITKAVNESLEKGKITRVYVNKKDLLNHCEMLVENCGPELIYRMEFTQENSLGNRIVKYLNAYITDKEGFIDREGTAYKSPEIKGSIGNDVIKAIVAIAWEAFYDSMLDMPVFYVMENGQKKYKTKTGKPPSVVKLGGGREEPIVPIGEKGIDEIELKIIQYKKGLLGDLSLVLAGGVYRLLGDLQLGAVVIAGHFSIGDNETLARILDETFLVSAKRATEFASYIGYKKITLPLAHLSMLVEGKGQAGTPAEALLVNFARLRDKKN